MAKERKKGDMNSLKRFYQRRHIKFVVEGGKNLIVKGLDLCKFQRNAEMELKKFRSIKRKLAMQA